MKAGIRVENAKALRSTLKDLGGKDLLGELKGAHKRVSDMLVAKALPNVPVRTGRLRRSVKALASQREARARAGSASVPYAAAIHWGRKTRGVIPARPFLWDAAQAIQDEAVDVYEKDVAALIDNALNKSIDIG